MTNLVQLFATQSQHLACGRSRFGIKVATFGRQVQNIWIVFDSGFDLFGKLRRRQKMRRDRNSNSEFAQHNSKGPYIGQKWIVSNVRVHLS